MKPSFRFFKWFGTSRGMMALGLVVVTSVLLSVFISAIVVAPPPPTYRADFGKAQWITAPGAQASAYFRKDIYIAQRPRHAWVLAAGPDYYNIYVNNARMQGNNPLGATGYQLPGVPTALVDVTPYLHIGINTISVWVMTSHYAYPGCIMIRGHIDYDIASEDFQTDTSWRASAFPGVLHNLMLWTDPRLDDVHWPLAQKLDFPDTDLIQPVTMPPWLYEQPLTSHWISGFSTLSRQMTFSTTFDLPAGEHDGWLQISTYGKNRVSINGRPVADSSEQKGIVDATLDTNIHFYWIQPWLKHGGNEISVSVDDPRESPSLSGQISYRNARGESVHVKSDGSWKALARDGTTTKAIDLGPINTAGQDVNAPAFQSSPAPYAGAVLTSRFIGEIFLSLVLSALFISIHLLTAEYLFRQGARTPSQALAMDAILHLPVLIGLVLLGLLHYDVHFKPEWAQSTGWIWLMLAFWIALRVLAVLQIRSGDKPPVQNQPIWFESELAQGFTLILGGITFLAFLLRVYSINLFDLDQDEILMNYCAQGVWQRGYPSVDNHGLVLRLTTYEFLPYPMALCGLIFGWHGWAVRIPAMLFGTFTAWNIGRMGRDLFSPFIGLLTAFVYTIIPLEVYFAAHCIHPQQTQFFMLLCIWAFYRANRQVGVLESKDFYKACVFFCCGYLSWEGSAFVLPALAVSLIFLHPGRFQWLRQFHLYAGLFAVSTFIIAQLVYRATKAEGYRAIGFGLSDLSPRAVFLEQTGKTDYYMSGIMLEQSHLLLDLGLILGFFFIARNRPLRYVVLIFCTLLFGYSNFLPVYTNRYFYFYQSMLVLGGCAGLCTALKAFIDFARELPFRLVRQVAWWSSGAAIAMLIAIAGNLGFKILGISILAEDPSTRYGMYWQESRPACEYIAEHFRPGDFVAGNYNYSYHYFTGKWVDFTVDQYLDQLAIYTTNDRGYGDYQNVYVRVRSFLNERDFINAFSHCKRMWYISSFPPSSGPDYISSINQFISHRSRIVYSGYDVYLYLAEGMATKEGEGQPDMGLPVSALPKYVAPSTNMVETTKQATAQETLQQR